MPAVTPAGVGAGPAQASSAWRPTVLFLPQWYRNPYQRLLDDELTRLGVRTQRPGRGFVPLVQSLLLHRPSILHLHWLQPFYESRWKLIAAIKLWCFALAVRWLRWRGTKIVWTVHNLRDHEQRLPGLDRRCTSLVVRRADAIIVHCRHAASQLREVYPLIPADRLFVIPHGHFMDAYENSKDRGAARGELGISEGRLVMLFFGNIRPYKGVLELIDAFAHLEAAAAELWIVGRPLVEGESNLVLDRAAAHSQIHYRPGFVDDDQIQLYMNAADVVVLPYRDVLTSGAAILAMSFGNACIAPTIGCIPETLNADGAFLYESGDPKGLEGALRRAVENREQLASMGEKNRERARQWAWPNIAVRTLEAYSSALGQSPIGPSRK